MRIIIPSYFYATHADWARVLKTKPRSAGVIFNPANGPGTEPDENYVTLRSRLSKRSITVYGYVYTKWGDRNIDDVIADIRRHQEFYNVQGIFFDEAATAVEQLPYYQRLYKRCKVAKLKVILNPGVTPDERYAQCADILCNVETDNPPALPAWVKKYPASKFWHILFNVPGSRLAGALRRCRNKAGYVYITDDSGDNPYDRLPTYWDRLCKL